MAILVVIWQIMLSSLSLITSEAVPEYRYHVCSSTTTFSSNSTYQSNLNDLLSSLTSNASRADVNNGFYNTTAGRDLGTVVYGSFLCRGDVTVDMCKECVATANRELVNEYCPTGKVAVIWYDHCMIRYSNESFFGKLDESPPIRLVNAQDITDPVRFNQLVRVTMSDSLTRAVSGSGAKKFATKEARFTASRTLYCLVQCTPNLSSSDCDACLGGYITPNSGVFYGTRGGNVLGGSCNIRYEVYPFYEFTAEPSPSPSPTPAPALLPPFAPQEKSRRSPLTIFGIVIAVSAVSLALLAAGCCIMRHSRAANKPKNISRENGESQITTVESLQFNLATIEIATNKFSEGYKLGEGGFGEVFKGILPNGQEIAVKRLSKSSGQGENEFKNEVLLVAKLQHRNLVRLLGFCLDAGEKLLVYEFVPNKSLDYFLFDPEKQEELDWSKRRKIIGGIAREILYLHEDSRLRVIHRDLKVSNILLDAEFNPKVSDFGMARMFGIDQTEGNTARIVGTYGYMAPEYAMEGLYSIKSDVFSFGVLLLEILSGRKNSGFYLTEFGSSLLIHAWNLWNVGKVMELMDPSLKQSCAANEFMRYVNIGLLCVQEDAYDRPPMSAVVLMLTTETISLSKPQRPAFSVGRNISRHHQLRPDGSISDNVLTISGFVPR